MLFTFFFARAGSVSLKRERELNCFCLERVEFFLMRGLSFKCFLREFNISCLDGVELDFLIFLRERES